MASFEQHYSEVRELIKRAFEDQDITIAEVIGVVGSVADGVACLCRQLLDDQSVDDVVTEVDRLFVSLVVEKDLDIPGVPEFAESWIINSIRGALPGIVEAALESIREGK